MRFRTALPLAIATVAAVQCEGRAAPDKSPVAEEAAPLPWMVEFPATKDPRFGLDEADLRKWIEKTHGNAWAGTLGVNNKSAWEGIYKSVLLLQTPAWKMDATLPAFGLSKFELTNAQWARFLEARQESYETTGAESLEEIVQVIWHIDNNQNTQAEITRGWRTLLATNGDVLMPVLNPKDDPKWDAQVARAQEAKLPKGLKLHYTRYMPPMHWAEHGGKPDGKVPEFELKKPMRNVSWEQAVDFCRWAGFHLPTEFEWERAARGTSGRKLTWEGEWNPLNAVWQGYNAAAIAAKKPEYPPITFPGQESDPPRENPCPMDVDLLAAGATPEGVLHMLGNVSELTSSTLTAYPGTRTDNKYLNDPLTFVARGGNFKDRAELMIATDRNMESHMGALLVSHAIDTYGFRLASYPEAGADLTYLMARRYADTSPAGLGVWLPLPAGCTDRKDAAIFGGFEVQRTAGVLERKLANDSAQCVFVDGPANGVAFLPVRGFPMANVKTAEDLKKLAANPEAPVVLGILTGTDDAEFEVIAPGGRKVPYKFGAKEFRYASPTYVQTTEAIGAVLILDGDKVAVYHPNDTLKGAAKYRTGFLGNLEAAPEFAGQRGPVEAPTGTLEGNVAVLSTTISLLNQKGSAGSGSSMTGIRVTLRVPFRRGAAR